MKTAPKFLLRFKNAYGETFFFVRHGAECNGLRLIEKTTADIAEAHQFDTAPEALAALKASGEPCGWEMITA